MGIQWPSRRHFTGLSCDVIGVTRESRRNANCAFFVTWDIMGIPWALGKGNMRCPIKRYRRHDVGTPWGSCEQKRARIARESQYNAMAIPSASRVQPIGINGRSHGTTRAYRGHPTRCPMAHRWHHMHPARLPGGCSVGLPQDAPASIARDAGASIPTEFPRDVPRGACRISTLSYRMFMRCR